MHSLQQAAELFAALPMWQTQGAQLCRLHLAWLGLHQVVDWFINQVASMLPVYRAPHASCCTSVQSLSNCGIKSTFDKLLPTMQLPGRLPITSTNAQRDCTSYSYCSSSCMHAYIHPQPTSPWPLARPMLLCPDSECTCNICGCLSVFPISPCYTHCLLPDGSALHLQPCNTCKRSQLHC